MQPFGHAYRSLASSTAADSLVVISLLLLGQAAAVSLGAASTGSKDGSGGTAAAVPASWPAFDGFDSALRPKPEALAACEGVDEGAVCLQLALGSLRMIANQRTIAAVVRFFGISSADNSGRSEHGPARVPVAVAGVHSFSAAVVAVSTFDASPLPFHSPWPHIPRPSALQTNATRSTYIGGGGGANVSTIALPAPEPRVACWRVSFELAALELRLHDEGRYVLGVVNKRFMRVWSC